MVPRRRRARQPGLAWSRGNHARPLIDGAACFRVLFDTIERTRAGDLICFTDRQGNPDERRELGGQLQERGADIARQAIAAPSYRLIHDPDGRPWRMRRRQAY